MWFKVDRNRDGSVKSVTNGAPVFSENGASTVWVDASTKEEAIIKSAEWINVYKARFLQGKERRAAKLRATKQPVERAREPTPAVLVADAPSRAALTSLERALVSYNADSGLPSASRHKSWLISEINRMRRAFGSVPIPGNKRRMVKLDSRSA